MRYLLLALLLAGASGPALAQSETEDGERSPVSRAQRAQRAEQVHTPRAERQAVRAGGVESSELEIERPQRRERPVRPERSDVARSVEVGTDGDVDRVERPGRRVNPETLRAPRDSVENPRRAEPSIAEDEDRRFVRTPGGFEDQRIETPGDRALRRVAGDTVRDWRRDERAREDSPATIEERNLRTAPAVSESTSGRLVQPGRRVRDDSPGTIDAPASTGTGSGALVQPRRPLPRVFDPESPRISRTPEFGTQPPAPASATTSNHRRPRWDHGWRRDHRYNWWDWRRRHRSLFHLGFYYDPFGWDYYRYRIGWRLWPSYYSSRYWLHDPWMYRLPRAYGPFRWVRYHDDALLVNLYTGEVVDVIHSFFW